MSPSFVLLLTLLFLTYITIVDAYDYFVMAVQWPPSVCRPATSPCVIAPLPKFTIHGMWPGDSITGARLSNCGGSAFDITLFSDKQKEGLDNAWPNWKGDNSQFWEDEWQKHGTCSENNLDQLQYFAKAVEIWLTLDTGSTLNKGSVIQNQPSSLTDIRNAINAATRHDPIVICVGGGRKRKTCEIQEIRVCIGMDYKFMACPKSAGKDINCKSQIYWLP